MYCAHACAPRGRRACAAQHNAALAHLDVVRGEAWVDHGDGLLCRTGLHCLTVLVTHRLQIKAPAAVLAS